MVGQERVAADTAQDWLDADPLEPAIEAAIAQVREIAERELGRRYGGRWRLEARLAGARHAITNRRIEAGLWRARRRAVGDTVGEGPEAMNRVLEAVAHQVRRRPERLAVVAPSGRGATVGELDATAARVTAAGYAIAGNFDAVDEPLHGKRMVFRPHRLDDRDDRPGAVDRSANDRVKRFKTERGSGPIKLSEIRHSSNISHIPNR